MSLDLSPVVHECSDCGYTIKKDDCVCRECVDKMLADAYKEGKEEGIEIGKKSLQE